MLFVVGHFHIFKEYGIRLQNGFKVLEKSSAKGWHKEMSAVKKFFDNLRGLWSKPRGEGSLQSVHTERLDVGNVRDPTLDQVEYLDREKAEV